MLRLLTFLFTVLSFPAFAQKKEKNTLLYSIKGEGIKTSYLFGTTHIIADSAFYFPQKLEKTLEKADVLVLEIDNLTDQSALSDKMMLASGSAFDIFTPEQADSVISWGSKELNMSPEVFRKGFEKRKPIALMQISVQTMTQGPVKMFELELIGRSRMNKQQVKGLETAEYQLSLFDNLPDSILAEMIMEPLRHPEESERSNRELTKLYLEQDVEGLNRLILESEEISGSADALVFQRNRNWIPEMGEMMKQNSCFFAVGAGHLGGEKGVIQLLKNEGYTITPIYY